MPPPDPRPLQPAVDSCQDSKRCSRPLCCLRVLWRADGCHPKEASVTRSSRHSLSRHDLFFAQINPLIIDNEAPTSPGYVASLLELAASRSRALLVSLPPSLRFPSPDRVAEREGRGGTTCRNLCIVLGSCHAPVHDSTTCERGEEGAKKHHAHIAGEGPTK